MADSSSITSRAPLGPNTSKIIQFFSQIKIINEFHYKWLESVKCEDREWNWNVNGIWPNEIKSYEFKTWAVTRERSCWLRCWSMAISLSWRSLDWRKRSLAPSRVSILIRSLSISFTFSAVTRSASDTLSKTGNTSNQFSMQNAKNILDIQL